MASTASFFRNRFIRSILVSGLLLQVGTWVRNFAILLYVMEKTNNDASAVSLISVAEFAPIFLFSFIGGTFADRWRPKRTMVWCDLLSAVSVIGVLATLVSGVWQAIFFATLVSAILSQFSQPSAMKLFKQHVPGDQLQMGMAIFQSMMAMFMVVGPALGTYVYQSFGINVSIAVMGVAFLLSAAALTTLPPDRKEEEEKPNTTIAQEMVAGFRYVLSKPVLRVLCGCFATAGFALGILQPMGVFIVIEQLGLPKENLQWFMMINGVGMMIGGGLTMAMAKKLAPHKLLTIGMVTTTITVAIIGVSTNLWLSLGAQFLSGLFLPTIHIGINTIMLQTTEEAFIGRANGILNPLFMGMMVLMMSFAGALKEWVGIVAMYEIAAFLFLIGVLIILPLYKMGLTAQPPQQQKEMEATAH